MKGIRGWVALAMVVVAVGLLVLGEESTHTSSFVIGASTTADGEAITLEQALEWVGADDYNDLVDPAFKGEARSGPNQAVWTVLSNRDLALQVTASIPVGSKPGRKMKAEFYVAFYPDAASSAGKVVVNDWSGLKNQAFTSDTIDLADYIIGEIGCKIILEAGVERKGLADKSDAYQMTLTLTVSGGGL